MNALLVVFSIFAALVTAEVSEELVETEQEAFAMCDTDGNVGLTWEEVERCEVGIQNWNSKLFNI